MPPIPVYTKSPINPAKAASSTTPPPSSAAAKHQPADVPTRTSSPPIQPQLNNPRTVTATPTRTIPVDQSPPPPQPGAVPRLPEATQASSAPSIPPAPQPIGISAPAITAAPIYPPPPQQLNIPPPQVPYNQRGTSTVPPAPVPAPTGSLSSLPYGQYGGGGSGGAYPSPYQGVGGVSGPQQQDEDEGILGSAMKLAKAAGQKLAEAESEVWKKINGEGN
jgi:hypothetical protein